MDDDLLKTLLKKTGKARFVDWLEHCRDDLTISETIKNIRAYKEYGYTQKSYETRVHNIRTIKKAARVNDALFIILSSDKLPKETKSKAFNLLEDDVKEVEAGLPSAPQLPIDEDIETDRLAKIKIRIGQNRFRAELLKKWNGCTITGYSDCSLLIASHIKPWRSSNSRERVDPENGLLLLPHLDKLFDKGFISFANDGHMLISKELSQPEVFNLPSNISIHLSSKCQRYMKFHRENIFLRSSTLNH